MKFLEKDLEEILEEQLSTRNGNGELQEKGLYLPHYMRLFRQKRIGNYGVTDLVGVERCGNNLNIDVIELKKENISMSSFLQATRYAKGIQRYLFGKRKIQNVSINIRIILIGKTIDTKSELVFLTDIFENIDFYVYNYGFDGINFKKIDYYSLINEGFVK